MTTAIATTSFRVTEYRAFVKNTLQAFVTIELPSGLVISGITYHQQNQSRWVSMPAQKYEKSDGSTGWMPVLDFSNKEAREHFQRSALDAIDSYLAN